MFPEGFEWDPEKAGDNLRKHGVRFEESVEVFADPFSHEEYQVHESGEVHWQIVGRTRRGILAVVYTERGSRLRLISAREATRRERRAYEQSR